MYPAVQLHEIGRIVESRPDVLTGFNKTTIEINNNIYPILVEDKNEKTEIKGLVLEITQKELLKLDEYETKAYKRIKTITKNGKKVWVYCKP